MGMVECLYTQVTDEVKCMVININYDKAIIVVDTTLWVPSHVHNVKDWDRYPLLLSIRKTLGGCSIFVPQGGHHWNIANLGQLTKWVAI